MESAVTLLKSVADTEPHELSIDEQIRAILNPDLSARELRPHPDSSPTRLVVIFAFNLDLRIWTANQYTPGQFVDLIINRYRYHFEQFFLNRHGKVIGHKYEDNYITLKVEAKQPQNGQHPEDLIEHITAFTFGFPDLLAQHVEKLQEYEIIDGELRSSIEISPQGNTPEQEPTERPVDLEPASTDPLLNEFLGSIATITALQESLKEQERQTVLDAKDRGLSWQAIGNVFGISRQGAYRRFSDSGREWQQKHNEQLRTQSDED